MLQRLTKTRFCAFFFVQVYSVVRFPLLNPWQTWPSVFENKYMLNWSVWCKVGDLYRTSTYRSFLNLRQKYIYIYNNRKKIYKKALCHALDVECLFNYIQVEHTVSLQVHSTRASSIALELNRVTPPTKISGHDKTCALEPWHTLHPRLLALQLN